MVDEEITRNFFQNIHDLWIEPEISKRTAAGTLPEDFHILRCLIRLPQDKPPIVEFNDEVSWRAVAKRGDGQPFQEGNVVFLHEILEIESALPPEVDGRRVAFVFIYWNGFSYEGCFDFSPNWPENELTESAREWAFGPVIAKYLQALLNERAVTMHEQMQEILQKIGLWIAPALLPYPLAQIVKQIDEGDTDGARSTLVSFCTPEFLKGLSTRWWNVPAFQSRRGLIEEAIKTHELGFFHSTIHTLLPQAEGIITDWEYSLNIEHSTIPFRTESKTKKFRDLVLSKPQISLTHRKVIESASSFMLDGPVLNTFKQWLDHLDLNFPNRHVIGHGRYEEALFTEENSVKTFLLLDTIYRIIEESNITLEGS